MGKTKGRNGFGLNSGKPSRTIDAVRASETGQAFNIDLALKNQLKTSIESIIQQEGDATFIRLERLDGFKGKRGFYGDASCNVLLWPGVSHEAIAALDELVQQKRIRAKILSEEEGFLIYSYEGFGGFRNIPLATATGLKNGYKELHWLPILYLPRRD